MPHNYRGMGLFVSPDILMVGGAPTEKEGHSKQCSKVEREGNSFLYIAVPLGVVRTHGLCCTVQHFTLLEIFWEEVWAFVRV